MGNFLGGSAYAMAKEVGEGFHLLTERTFARMLPSEMEQLAFEMDRRLRELRGEKMPIDDPQATQKHSRKMLRLQGALSMLRGYRQRARR